MSDYLTNSRADALADVSNIVQRRDLGGSGPVDLTRLDRVAAALSAFRGEERVTLYGVVDRSLFSSGLDLRQRRTLREWERDRKIVVVGTADPELLREGERTHLPIISHDHYRGYLRDFSYLTERDGAVLEPVPDSGGTIVLQPVEYGSAIPDWEMSRSEEDDTMRQQGIRESRDEDRVFSHFWSCPEPRCPRHNPASRPFVLLPRLLQQDRRLVCELHGLDMEDQGLRSAAVQLKIRRCGQVRHWFTVAEGQPVIVGRSAEGADLLKSLDIADQRRVSRTHLRFDLDAGELTVTDLSTNGTMLFLHSDRVETLWLRRNAYPFAIGDRAEIVPGLDIVRSGRRHSSQRPARGQQPAMRQEITLQ